jgi:phage terminase small subunit
VGKPLNEKQAKFVELYLNGNGNLAETVKAAGYNMTEKAAAVHATRLLKNAKVQQAIREARQARQEAYTVTAAWVLEQIAKIAQDEEAATRDRLKALEMLSKHFGLLEKQADQDADGVHVVFEPELKEWSE